MKLTMIKLSIAVLTFLISSDVSFALECNTPEKVVNAFLQYDLEGARLGSDVSARIDELETDNMYEPGWDISTLVTDFQLKTIKKDGNEATASILFKKAWETEREFDAKNVKDQTSELHLKSIGGCWKIAPPVYNPHVSVEALLKHFLELEKDAREHTHSQTEKDYLIWVRQQISNFEKYRTSTSR